jgi:O-antigen ligase
MILSCIAAALVVLVAVCTRRRPLWGLYIVMVSVPLSYKQALEGTPLYCLVELTLVPFALVILAGRNDLWKYLKRSPFLAFVPFLGFIILSAFWAENPAAVAKEVVRWGEFVLMGLTAACVIDRRNGFDKPIAFLGWIGATISVVGIVQFLQGVNQQRYRPGAEAFLGHPNATAAFLCLCILPILGLVVQERRIHLMKRITVFLVLLLGLAFTFSRGVFLSCMIGGAFFLFDAVRSRLVRNRSAVTVVIGIVLTLIGLGGIPRFRQTAADRIISQTLLDGRQFIFSFGWSIYKQRPWFGLGAGNLKNYALQYGLQVHKAEPFIPNYGDLHNLYLQLAVETGLIGLLLFLGGVLCFSVILVRRKRFPNDSIEPLYRSLWAASLAYLLANCSGYYIVKGIFLEWAVLLAVQVAMTQATPSDDAEAKP